MAMASSVYSELLKDPRWQKMRLEILDRDGWRCTHCEAADKTLHVHHGFYSKGLKPWDYPESSLRTFCEDCHKIAGERRTLLASIAGRLPIYAADLVIGFAAGVQCERDPEFMAPVKSWYMADGIAAGFGLRVPMAAEKILMVASPEGINAAVLEAIQACGEEGPQDCMGWLRGWEERLAQEQRILASES